MEQQEHLPDGIRKVFRRKGKNEQGRYAMRKLVANHRKSNVTELRCADCGWMYTIHHFSTIVDDIEEHRAIRLFNLHVCADFPADAILKAS
jgi:hypothetical protein